MRERLIELIKQAYATCHETPRCTKCGYAGEGGGCFQHFIADHLLANGVIVPPCKVGDTAYYHKAELDEICPTKVIGIYNNLYTPSMPLWIEIEYESRQVGRQVERMSSNVFDLLCKCTKEEAVEALKGVEG